MSEINIRNFLAVDSTNAYTTSGLGDYNYKTHSYEMGRFKEASFLTNVSETQKCATFIYECFDSPKSNLSKDYAGITNDDNIFFGVFVPKRMSGDNRTNIYPHGLMFSCKEEDFAFNPAYFINSPGLIEAFKIVTEESGLIDEINGKLDSINYRYVDKGVHQFGDSFFSDDGIEEFGLNKKTNKKRLILEIIDKLIDTDFNEPVVVIAPEKDLALIVKSVLLMFKPEVAKKVSFVINATTSDQCEDHILVAVSDNANKSIYDNCKNILRYSSVDGVYKTTFVNSLDNMDHYDPNSNSIDEDLARRLLKEGKFKAYFDNSIPSIDSTNVEGNCNLINSLMQTYSFDQCFELKPFNDALLAVFTVDNNPYEYNKTSMRSLESMPIDHDKLAKYIAYSIDKGSELYALFLRAAIREIFTPVGDVYLQKNNATPLLKYFDEIVTIKENILNVNGVRQAFCSDGFVYSKAFMNYINDQQDSYTALCNYASVCLNFIIFSNKIHDSALNIEELISFIFENVFNDICRAFIKTAFERGTIEDKYRMIKFLIMKSSANSDRIDLTSLEPDPSNVGDKFVSYIKNEIKSIVVQDASNVEYNAKLVHDLASEHMDVPVEHYPWLIEKAMRDFMSMDELLAANNRHQSHHDEAMDLVIHYKTSLYLSKFFVEVRLEDGSVDGYDSSKIKEVFNDTYIVQLDSFYHSSYTKNLSQKQMEMVKEDLIINTIDAAIKKYTSNSSAYQILFSPDEKDQGYFSKRRQEFIQLTKDLPDADRQTKRLFSTTLTSNFVMAFVWFIISVGLLAPIYFLNKTVFYAVIIMPALSALASIIVNFAFARSDKKVLSWHVFRANLWGVFIPELIVLAILLLLMWL